MIISQDSYPTIRKPPLLAACGILCLLLAGAANSDTQAKSDKLKTCLDNNIAAEIAKARPSTDAVLAQCDKEFMAVTERLTPKGKAKIKKKLGASVKQNVAKSKK